MIHSVGFGPHLMLDIWGCDISKLSDLEVCYKFLDTLPGLISMTKITQPHVFHYSGLVPEDKGITGAVIIAESHISIHTFPIKDYAFIDIFSCKPFDIDLAISVCEEIFCAKEKQYWIQDRGVRFKR